MYRIMIININNNNVRIMTIMYRIMVIIYRKQIIKYKYYYFLF